jgi:hypothetical protein
MTTRITFTDEDGAVVCETGKPNLMDRLAGFVPLVRTVGPEGGNPVGLGNGITYGWEHRVDFGCRFSLEHIPQAKLEDFQRLYLWLLRGVQTAAGTEGRVTLETGDVDEHTYVCRIWPGFEPAPPEQLDRNAIEYRMTLELLNTEQARMVCSYDESVGLS